MEEIMPDATVLVQAVVFLLALLIIKSLILNPISDVLKGRAERIEGAEQEALRLDQESTALDLQYKKKIQEARAKAQEARNQIRQEVLASEKEILDSGRQQAQAILKRMRDEIGRESAEARTQLRGEVAFIAQRFAEKILGRSLQ